MMVRYYVDVFIVFLLVLSLCFCGPRNWFEGRALVCRQQCSVFHLWYSRHWFSITSSTITTTPQYQTEIALNMSDDDMGEEYPTTIDHMKTSPSTSPRSAPLRENSVILEARDAGQHGESDELATYSAKIKESSKQYLKRTVQIIFSRTEHQTVVLRYTSIQHYIGELIFELFGRSSSLCDASSTARKWRSQSCFP